MKRGGNHLVVTVSATRRAAMRSASGAASARSSAGSPAAVSAARRSAAVTTAAGRTGHRPSGIGARTRRPTTIRPVSASSRSAWRWAAAGIRASAARRHDRLLHVERWPARSAIVEAAARIVLILPRRLRTIANSSFAAEARSALQTSCRHSRNSAVRLAD